MVAGCSLWHNITSPLFSEGGVGYLHRPIMEKNSPAARSQSRFSQGSGAARPESATPPGTSTPVTRGRGVAPHAQIINKDTRLGTDRQTNTDRQTD